jgi:hypothetical protein
MTRNIMLKVKIPAPDQVAENMSATVRVAVAPPRMLKLVPRDALVSLQGQDSVYTVHDGKSSLVPVRIVAYLGRKVAVDIRSPDGRYGRDRGWRGATASGPACPGYRPVSRGLKISQKRKKHAMDILRYAISKPVTVAVGMLLVALFGVIGLIRLPVQLAPDTELPKIEIFTMWPGASPSEIENEVVEKQEDKLKSIQDLQKMESSSYNDFAQITLTFGLGTDINTAVQRVSNKLDEVWDYPDDVKKPIINTSGANASPTIILTLKMRSGDPREVTRYQTYFENEIQQYLERVDGVASVMAFGGTADQLEVVVDPIKMARHGITINQVIAKRRRPTRTPPRAFSTSTAKATASAPPPSSKTWTIPWAWSSTRTAPSESFCAISPPRSWEMNPSSSRSPTRGGQYRHHDPAANRGQCAGSRQQYPGGGGPPQPASAAEPTIST